VSSNLTICAMVSNFHRAVLRRRPGRELRSHNSVLVNASAIYHLQDQAGVGKSLNLPEGFPLVSKRTTTDSVAQVFALIVSRVAAAIIRGILTQVQAFLSRSGSRNGREYRTGVATTSKRRSASGYLEQFILAALEGDRCSG
jgi:hypothetical protein